MPAAGVLPEPPELLRTLLAAAMVVVGVDSALVAARADAAGQLASDQWTPHRPDRGWVKLEGGRRFRVQADYEPAGDQPTAIKDLVEGLSNNDRTQVLLGRISAQEERDLTSSARELLQSQAADHPAYQHYLQTWDQRIAQSMDVMTAIGRQAARGANQFHLRVIGRG